MKKLLLAILLLATIGILYAGTSHTVYIELVDQGGQHPDTGVTFNAWIVGRESEVLTETSTGCGYMGASAGQYQGTAYVQCGTFPTQWGDGETLHVEANTPLGNGTGEFALNTEGSQFYGDMYGSWSEGPGITLIPNNPTPDPVTIPNGEEGAGDVVTPSTDTGTYVSDGYGDTSLQGEGYDTSGVIEGNIGIYTIVTLDNGAPATITVTLDGISYEPYDFAYYTNSIWHLIAHGTNTWTVNGSQRSTTFTINFAKGTKGNVNVPIAFANGPNAGNTLPVVLAEFNVEQLAQFAQITWITASENNLIGFQIRRATVDNLENAVVVSGLINATNETTGHSYSFTDRHVTANNTYYYWLEAKNNDGNDHFYKLGNVNIELDNTPSLPQVTALSNNYPNPFNPETTIKFSVKEGENGTLTIFNQKGQVVERKTFTAGNYEYTWDGTKYSSGIYFYKLQTPTYSRINKMIMLK